MDRPFFCTLLCTVVFPSVVLAAEVLQLDEANWRHVAPQGKEVDWIFGDTVMRNDKLVAVVAQSVAGRNANMTVRDVAGGIIDLTFRFRSNDQLSCYYPAAAEYPLRSMAHRVVDGEAIVTCQSEEVVDKPTVEVEYRLRDGDDHLTVITRYTNPHDHDVTFEVRDAVRADKGFEHSLANADFLTHDLWWRQAYGLSAVDHDIVAVADSVDRGRPIVAYQRGGTSTVTLPPQGRHQLTRFLIVGENELDVRARLRQLRNQANLVQLAVVVKGPLGKAVGSCLLTVSQGDVVVGRALGPEAGPCRIHLPPGSYTIEARKEGRGAHHVDVDLDTDQVTMIELPEPGYVSGTVRDESGAAIPAKIQYRGKQIADPDFGPDTKSFLVKNVQYTASGDFEVELAPGAYDVIISRGPEYDADVRTIQVERGETVRLEATLSRSVDTRGWVSSDFHSHSSPSGDNTSEQLGRVLNLLAEHIEFAPCTEHNRISSYAPHLEVLRAQAFMATCTGMELTGSPLPINHQNAFPLEHHPHTQDGGGPTADENPLVQIERLAMWDAESEKLVQENHPNLEQIWADRDLDGSPDDGFEKMFGFMDVVEVHPPNDIFAAPGTQTGEYRNVIQSWLRMLNKGYRIPGVVNTDAHYNFHGSGWLRNYIQCSTDDPAQIDTLEIVRAAERGHVVMTNGPFLEVTARSGDARVIPGDDLQASGGDVELQIRVQCANWLEIDRVQVFVNGRPSPTHNFTRRTTPDKFRDGVVKFDERISLELDADAHLIVATTGDGQTLGPVMGPEHGMDVPAALTNPIFVDVDGNGFQPNGDLLGLPFPYKAE